VSDLTQPMTKNSTEPAQPEPPNRPAEASEAGTEVVHRQVAKSGRLPLFRK
jgi:hypothetical protein